MNLKNYSSTIEYQKSIESIKKLLIEYGAYSVIEKYENKEVSGIAFVMPIDNKAMTFQLPARVSDIKNFLIKTRRMSPENAYKQAQKTAWKLIHEWIQIQLTMIALDQAEPLELFFPYLTDGVNTYYEKVKANDFKQLTN